jgi:hypothetical protein
MTTWNEIENKIRRANVESEKLQLARETLKELRLARLARSRNEIENESDCGGHFGMSETPSFIDPHPDQAAKFCWNKMVSLAIFLRRDAIRPKKDDVIELHKALDSIPGSFLIPRTKECDACDFIDALSTLAMFRLCFSAKPNTTFYLSDDLCGIFDKWKRIPEERFVSELPPEKREHARRYLPRAADRIRWLAAVKDGIWIPPQGREVATDASPDRLIKGSIAISIKGEITDGDAIFHAAKIALAGARTQAGDIDFPTSNKLAEAAKRLLVYLAATGGFFTKENVDGFCVDVGLNPAKNNANVRQYLENRICDAAGLPSSGDNKAKVFSYDRNLRQYSTPISIAVVPAE